MSRHNAAFRSWNSMSGREQAVWGASYAASPPGGLEAAVHADRVVATLASVSFPESEPPEQRAARLVRGLTREEFRGWYTVELQLAHPGQPPRRLSEDELSEAYMTYAMCSTDFY